MALSAVSDVANALESKVGCQKKTTSKACRIKAANMAAKKACQSLRRSHSVVPIRGSSATRGERSSRETKRGPSKFIGRIKTGREPAARGSSCIGRSVRAQPGAIRFVIVTKKIGVLDYSRLKC